MTDHPQESAPQNGVSVLFVCLGNICRSPTAEGVFRSKVEKAGLGERVRVDSAGVGSWHVGERPDKRAIEAATRRGFDLGGQRGRKIEPHDMDEFDYVLAMDESNLRELEDMLPGKAEPFLNYAANREEQDIPDPYGGDGDQFEYVLDLIEEASDGLLEDVKRRLA